MTTNIYLIRHGEVYNPKKIVYGRLPRFRLSKKGELEIEHTAKFLKDKNITKIYSSPLLRARQTAVIIQKKLELPKISIEKNLLEIKTSLEGKFQKNLNLMSLDYFSSPIRELSDDTMEDVSERMNKAVNKFLRLHKGHSVVAISHGDPIMILKAIINEQPLKLSSIRPKIYLGHGEITHVQKIDEQPLSVKSVFVPLI
ncbi:MAG TPA: histidine phosphatase family protein [Candidatus Limnocylindrales bacterium]|nr:histidine phosphatase family protein [Candidatus Limnocylindrales bacterium]